DLENKPNVLVNASAVGIYPTSKAAVYTESSTQKSTDFLGRTVKKWEEIAKRAEAYGVRTVFTRFGVILGSGGGALKLMAMPYDFYIGGKLGSGMQWVSWVHIDDVVGAIDFVISDDTISGPVNVTAPHPVRMEQFGKTIAEIKRKPHWFPTPAPLLKAALGEKSKMVLEGQNVKPTVLLEHGYTFHYPKLYDALSNLL
ncbi:MAG: TIGR01777 family oxidoreductase, partial [Kurthia sp.]|nr:TIGR01777 family oxidoreductase [Kurthia sp.]